MNIDITKLKSGIEDYIEINEIIDIDITNTEILELKNTKLKGTVMKDSEGYYMDTVLSGIMILPCSITLKPVEVPFECSIAGNIEEMLLEIGKIEKKTENTIDIFPIIWENILMEIPIRVVSEDAQDQTFEGDGWKLITDEVSTSPNPELEKLKDLLK